MTGGLANRLFENIAVQNADKEMKELHYPIDIMDIIFQFIKVLVNDSCAHYVVLYCCSRLQIEYISRNVKYGFINAQISFVKNYQYSEWLTVYIN